MEKVLIFDLDGTLADTLPSILHAINIAMKKFNYPEKTYEDVRRAIGNGARLLVKRVMPKSETEDENKVQTCLDYYNKMYETTYIEADKCYDGMKETVETLVKRGYKVAILSNKPDLFVRNMAKNLFSAGTISYAAGQRENLPTKPDAQVPLEILKKLGGTPQTSAFIGDSEVDILTAKNCKMMSVGCEYGYRNKEVLKEYGAEKIISNPEELLEIFM